MNLFCALFSGSCCEERRSRPIGDQMSEVFSTSSSLPPFGENNSVTCRGLVGNSNWLKHIRFLSMRRNSILNLGLEAYERI